LERYRGGVAALLDEVKMMEVGILEGGISRRYIPNERKILRGKEAGTCWIPQNRE
jgi:hypothetical protein